MSQDNFESCEGKTIMCWSTCSDEDPVSPTAIRIGFCNHPLSALSTFLPNVAENINV
jgi:hypothetical protein